MIFVFLVNNIYWYNVWHKATCESSLKFTSSLSKSRSVPGGRQHVGQAANLTLESACRLSLAKHSPIAMYYYSTMRSILIYLPSEGGRLSRPTAANVQPVSKAKYSSAFCENTNCLQH